MPKNIIAFDVVTTEIGHYVYALCEDDSIWRKLVLEGDWEQLNPPTIEPGFLHSGDFP